MRVAVFSLRVPESTSLPAFSNFEGRRIVGFHGLLYADAVSAQVMRLEIQADLPPGFPVQEAAVNVDYGEVTIANQAFFLPCAPWCKRGSPDISRETKPRWCVTRSTRRTQRSHSATASA